MISNLKSYLKIVLHTDDYNYNETKLIDDYDVDVVGSSSYPRRKVILFLFSIGFIFILGTTFFS